MTSATDPSSGPSQGTGAPQGLPADAPTVVAAAPSTEPGKGPAINETVIYEGGPALGDLIGNLLFALTIIGIPFAVGAIVRALWVRYRITSRRLTVNGGWFGRDRTQVVYSQIREVRSAPRGLGAWGDMVLVLTDGTKLELRSLPRFREVEAYIEERRRQTPATPKVAKPTNGFGSPDAAAS